MIYLFQRFKKQSIWYMLMKTLLIAVSEGKMQTVFMELN